MNSPTFISDADVARTLTPSLLLETVEHALAGMARRDVINGGKVGVTLDDDDGTRTLLAMVGVDVQAKIAGVKWVGTYDGNKARGLPRAPATMILTDSVTGSLLAIVEATSLTARRTAAAAVVAAKHCMQSRPRRAAILGFGAIGKSLVPLLAAAFGLEAIGIWGGDMKRLRADAERLQSEHGVEITVHDGPGDAARNADIVFTASGLSQDQPFLTRAMVGDRTTICAMGSYQEIADDLVRSSDVLVVDDWASCAKRGNLASLVHRGQLSRSDVQMELPALVAQGGLNGRSKPVRLPTVVMIGLGALDVAIAKKLLPR